MRLDAQGIVPKGAYGVLTHNADQTWSVSYINGKDNTVNTVAVQEHPLMRDMSLPGYRVIGREGGMVDVIRYASLHQHTDGSLLDGMTTVKELVAATEYAGAITDHGAMYGFLEFYQTMKAAGKKPIIGIEAYMSELDGSLARRHIILLAKDLTGYKNLLKLASSSSDHFYYVPHVTWEMLQERHEGIICLSACLGGIIPKALVEGRTDDARAAIERFIEIFGKDDFYIEIQKHGIPDEDRIRPQLVALAKEYGLKYVATTDAHYPKPEDREVHQVLLCLHDKKKMDDTDKRVYQGDGYYLHTSEQMEQRFSDYPEALDTSLEIAGKCDLEIPLGEINLPKYQFPAPFKDADEYMLHLAQEGFKSRFTGTPHLEDPVYLERFNYEMDMIRKMGFCAYFVIVWDFINYARRKDIPVGPGRGSAAGSLVAYCMGITDMDPIRYNLMFERFLNPARVSMPDIDTDIAHTGRPKVIRYLFDKYGEKNVCRIITFGTFAPKGGIKDVARVYGLPSSFSAKLSGMMPVGIESLKVALDTIPEFAEAYKNDPNAKKVIDIAMRLEGRKRHASIHACFDAHTLVTTKSGIKYICNIKPGDMVLTHTGKYQKVVDTMVTKSKDIHRLKFSNGKDMVVTGNHPLLAVRTQKVEKKTVSHSCQWAPVDQLHVGDMVVSRNEFGMEFIHITSHERVQVSQPREMYNLTVANDSSYVANSIVAHNCGIVIAPSEVSDYMPTIAMTDPETGDRVIASQVVMTEVEPLSLIKMDLLGLKNLTAIDDTIKAAVKNHGIEAVQKIMGLPVDGKTMPKYQDIPMDDRETYAMLSQGVTGAVFQFESPGMTKLVKDMLSDLHKISNADMGTVPFERLIAAVALYRPGPMDYIPDYIAGMKDPNDIHYDCPEEAETLASTYGVIVYQEQLIQLVRRLAGYSLGEADLLRRACSKKKAKDMAKEHTRFVKGDKKSNIPGCEANGISVAVAEEIWKKMAKFAEYAFNRSHAACYSWLGYITAFLSCHFPAEFYASMLNAFIAVSGDKSKAYMAQASSRGIPLQAPNVQRSRCQFTAQKDGSILLGLQAIAGVKDIAVSIVADRDENGPFADLQDLYSRMQKRDAKLDKTTVEGLVFSGALKPFDERKASLLAQYTAIEKDYKANANMWEMGQLSLFSEEEKKVPIPKGVRQFDETFELKKEHDAIGMFLSKHPADMYLKRAERDERYKSIPELLQMSPSRSRKQVQTMGLVRDLSEFYTRTNNELMATFTLETKFASISCVVFPRYYATLRPLLLDNTVFCFSGNIIADNKNDEDEGAVQYSVQKLMYPYKEFPDDSTRIIVSIKSKEEQEQLRAFAHQHPGPIRLTLEANGEYFNPPSCCIADDPIILSELHRLFDVPGQTA